MCSFGLFPADRAEVFAKWLVDTYGLERLQSGGGVLDVAGGKGDLASELHARHGVRCTVVDPAPWAAAPAAAPRTWSQVCRCIEGRRRGGAAARRRPFCPLAAISTVRFDTPWPPDTGMTHLNNRSANLSTRISRPGTDTSSSPARNKCRSSLASTRTSRLERL